MINQDTAVVGKIYFVSRQPERFGGTNLVGKPGICRWSNYRGICLRFNDDTSYVIPYDCIYDENENAAA